MGSFLSQRAPVGPAVMEPGGYSFGDYVKVGLPLLFLTMLITVALVTLICHF
jgi:di/tricarboxylate transporter